ncbi:MAG: hypothetical protein DRO11_05135 [Methanobacteriota archaeon]|nr:MAG: hypothetical protein DRO11_05135 [Euryarchaeota archaeon]
MVVPGFAGSAHLGEGVGQGRCPIFVSDNPSDGMVAEVLAGHLGCYTYQVSWGGSSERDVERVVDVVDSRRDDCERVVIVGGPKAVSATLERVAVDKGFVVERLGGVDRYETAALVAKVWGRVAVAYLVELGQGGVGERSGLLEEVVDRAKFDSAPLLYVPFWGLPGYVVNVLSGLGVKRVYVSSLKGDPSHLVDELKALGFEARRLVFGEVFSLGGREVVRVEGVGGLFVPIYKDLRMGEGGEKAFFIRWRDGKRRIGSQHVIRVEKIDVEKQNVFVEFDGRSYLVGYNVDRENPGLNVGGVTHSPRGYRVGVRKIFVEHGTRFVSLDVFMLICYNSFLQRGEEQIFFMEPWL